MRTGYADLLVGVASGRLRAYRNLANASAPDAVFVPWPEQPPPDAYGVTTPSDDPLRAPGMRRPVSGSARPYLVDVDADADLDLFISCGGCGGGENAVHFFRNLGTPTRAQFVRSATSMHPLAEAAAMLIPTEAVGSNATRLPAPPLAFGDLNDDGAPEAVLAGVVLHLLPAVGASTDDPRASDDLLAQEVTEAAAARVFRVPRLPGEYTSPNPLVSTSLAVDEQVTILDVDSDGDEDAMIVSSGEGAGQWSPGIQQSQTSGGHALSE